MMTSKDKYRAKNKKTQNSIERAKIKIKLIQCGNTLLREILS